MVVKVTVVVVCVLVVVIALLVEVDVVMIVVVIVEVARCTARSKLRVTFYNTLLSLYGIGGFFFAQLIIAFLNALKICNRNAGFSRRSGKARK